MIEKAKVAIAPLLSKFRDSGDKETDVNALALSCYLRGASASTVVIEVAVKSVYGALKIYPVNESAKALAELCGTKTLSNGDLDRAAMAFGFEIKEVPAYSLSGVL